MKKKSLWKHASSLTKTEPNFSISKTDETQVCNKETEKKLRTFYTVCNMQCSKGESIKTCRYLNHQLTHKTEWLKTQLKKTKQFHTEFFAIVRY